MFIRFAEYLYGGDYISVKALIVMEQEEYEDTLRDTDLPEPTVDEPGEAIPKDDPFHEPLTKQTNKALRSSAQSNPIRVFTLRK